MLTKGAIGNLVNRYRAVLKKCHLINVFGSLAVACAVAMGGADTAKADTIPQQLETDITLTKTDYSYQTGTGDKSLDLNGHTIQASTEEKHLTDYKNDALIIVNRGSSLTIEDSGSDGKLQAHNLYCGVKLTYTGENDATKKASLTVNGGTISSKYYGISGNGTRHNTEININGGTILSTGDDMSDPEQGTAIYHPQDGTLNISGGVITGQKTGIEMRSGTLDISGGEITGLGEFKAEANNNGPTVSGAALAISQHTTNKDITVTVTGGTFTGYYAIYEADLQDDTSSNVSIDIQDGMFSGKIYSENVKDFISGGTFSHPTALNYLSDGADISVTLQEDYTGGDGSFSVKSDRTVTMNLGDYKFTMDEGSHIVNEGDLTVTGGTFSDNKNPNDWGGAILNKNNGSVTVTDTAFENNIGSVGGAIGADATSGSLAVQSSTFRNNHAIYDGGAIGSYKKLSIVDSVFEGNTAQLAQATSGEWTEAVEDSIPVGGGALSLGAVSDAKVASIENTVFKNNTSGKNGGAIGTRLAKDANNSAATLDIAANFEGNHAYQNGGAIYNTFYSSNDLGKGNGVTISGLFSDNSAGENGGAIYNDGTQDKGGNTGGVISLRESTFTGNEAQNDGGAVSNSSGATLSVKDTVFTGNKAGGEGGAIAIVNDINYRT